MFILLAGTIIFMALLSFIFLPAVSENNWPVFLSFSGHYFSAPFSAIYFWRRFAHRSLRSKKINKKIYGRASIYFSASLAFARP